MTHDKLIFQESVHFNFGGKFYNETFHQIKKSYNRCSHKQEREIMLLLVSLAQLSSTGLTFPKIFSEENVEELGLNFGHIGGRLWSHFSKGNIFELPVVKL